MASTTGGSTLPKCKYWNKCYRKEKAHLKQYLHPVAQTHGEVKGRTDQSKKCGNETSNDLKGKKATSVDQRSLTSDLTRVLLSQNTPGPLTRSRSQSGIGNENMDATTSAKQEAIEICKIRRQRTHSLSDSEDELPPKKTKISCGDSTAKQQKNNESIKCHEKISKQTDAGEGQSCSKNVQRPFTKKMKCKYWNKCYSKDANHRKTYQHPSDEQSSERKDNSHHTLSDGGQATVNSREGTYHIKRTGDTYQCNCIGWNMQKRPVNKRTCKHLKDYLGEEVESKRTGAAGTKENKGGEATIFRAPKHKNVSLLLAHKYTESTDPTGWWISEKLDGVRAYWDGKSFYSRLGNEFIPPDWFTENLPSHMDLDGELFGGRGKFQETVAIVKNAGSARWSELKYYIFDSPKLGSKKFEDRIKEIKDYFSTNSCKTAVVVDQTRCKGREHINEKLKDVEALGGEGLMIRQPGSKYEHRRSQTLLKIKTFYDAEALVIGHEKGKGRNAFVTGALRCKMECGKEFSVGSGLSDELRKKPPKLGSIITYKFQEYTKSGYPRFPTFIGVRVDMDEPKDAILPEGKQ